ncbi:hypothetical protein ABVT39_004468 [Epinephelus coioides]
METLCLFSSRRCCRVQTDDVSGGDGCTSVSVCLGRIDSSANSLKHNKLQVLFVCEFKPEIDRCVRGVVDTEAVTGERGFRDDTDTKIFLLREDAVDSTMT